MKCLNLIYLLLLCSFFMPVSVLAKKVNINSSKPVSLILDTDIGPDFDDVGAMALMHALADSGKVNILAVIASNKNDSVVPVIEIINNYFGRPDIPTGGPKSEGGVNIGDGHAIKWTKLLMETYSYKIKSTTESSDAVEVYRKILSKQPDNSVVICTIGFLTNLKDLLNSAPDKYSSLNGMELVKKKVNHIVTMGGGMPEGREFNIYLDTKASQRVAKDWPTEIIFSGFEIGNPIRTGTIFLSDNKIKNSPIKDVFVCTLNQGEPQGRQSWDQTAVLVAINGYEPYFNVERGNFIIVNDEGNNIWEADANGRDLRLIEKLPVTQMADIIEGYMIHQPTKK